MTFRRCLIRAGMMPVTGLFLFFGGCSPSLQKADITESLNHRGEAERLRYFKEIRMDLAQREFGLTGNGVTVTVMGEMVDSSHPDLEQRIVKQYNTIFSPGNVLPGQDNRAFGYEVMRPGDGHGTHIAGTIAAECDGVGIRGIACGALLEVYDFASYGNVELLPQDVDSVSFYSVVLDGFGTALRDITTRKSSRVLTGSFNFEAPYIPFERTERSQNMSDEVLLEVLYNTSVEEIIDMDLFVVSEADWVYLAALEKQLGETFRPADTFLPALQGWRRLTDAIADYQQTDGVYIVTESNNVFDRTSILNALPVIAENMDKDRWISAVMVMPKGLTELAAEKNVTEEEMNALITGREYETVINSCGEIAAEYCILIPSYSVLSTVTEQVAEFSSPYYVIDGRGHQVYTGHSMGAPMIAAALALMQENNVRNNTNYSMKDLVAILKQSADRRFKGYDPKRHGQGLLDIHAALKAM